MTTISDVREAEKVQIVDVNKLNGRSLVESYGVEVADVGVVPIERVDDTTCETCGERKAVCWNIVGNMFTIPTCTACMEGFEYHVAIDEPDFLTAAQCAHELVDWVDAQTWATKAMALDDKAYVERVTVGAEEIEETELRAEELARENGLNVTVHPADGVQKLEFEFTEEQ